MITYDIRMTTTMVMKMMTMMTMMVMEDVS